MSLDPSSGRKPSEPSSLPVAASKARPDLATSSSTSTPTSTSTVDRAQRAARRAQQALSRASRRAVMTAAFALGTTLMVGAQAEPAAVVGERAPDFIARDTEGRSHRLSDYAGRYVVLEWTNPGCPFVRKHYGSGNLPATQKAATERGTVWLAINSTERGAGDYLEPQAMAVWMREHGAAPTAVLMDEDGVVGHAYAARTTPHLYIVDPRGVLVYAGGIDSIASVRTEDIRVATNYVRQALDEAMAGRAITAATTRPYGCSIKYRS